MDEDFADLFSSSDDELYEGNVRRPYTVRERPNHFERWDDVDFFRRFRLRKETVEQVLRLIENEISHRTDRNNAVPAMHQLLMTLRFYSVGNAYTAVGDFGGVHKSTAGLIVKRVTEALARLRPQFVRLPTTPDEIIATQQEFYELARFPRVVGCIDCTHVKLKSPGGNNAETFRNRKGYFSLNVQAVADANLKILDIVARWPGSAHDATIFNNSRVKARFENNEFGNGLLLGDSGYAVKQYLITPLSEPATPVEHLFNESQIRSRNVVERTFGEKRFPILSIGMEVALPFAQNIIVATAILHNLACMYNDEPPQDGEFDFEDDAHEQVEPQVQENNALPDNRVRHSLIYDYFSRLL